MAETTAPHPSPGASRADHADYYAAIVEYSDDAILSKDPNGIITTWNPAAERLYGYAAREAIGQPISILIPEHRAGEERRILAEVMTGERIDHYETERVRKDGRVIEISVSVSQASAGRLEVLPLNRPDVRSWREAYFGAEPPHTPTLLRVRQDGVRGWTGPSIAPVLVRRLGTRSTVRVLVALGRLREQPMTEDARPSGRRMDRAQFLRLCAGAAVGGGAGAGAGCAASGEASMERRSKTARMRVPLFGGVHYVVRSARWPARGMTR